MKKKHFVSLLIIMLFAIPSMAQTAKILYITPDYRTGAEYDKIRAEFSAAFRSCLQEKYTREISFTTWDRSAAKSSLLKGLRVNYVLMLDQLPVIKSTDRNIDVSFKLIYVDDTYTPREVTWNNSVYVLELNDVLGPTNTKNLVSDVCEEIDFYLQSSPDPTNRKFRPRIKINELELAGSGMEEIDINAFCKWLSKVLEDKYSVEPNYVFYYNRKYDKQYPDNSVYKISGKFSKHQGGGDNLVNVQLIIEFPDAYDVDAAVIDAEKFSSDERRKEDLVKNIIAVLEQEINYYGKD